MSFLGRIEPWEIALSKHRCSRSSINSIIGRISILETCIQLYDYLTGRDAAGGGGRGTVWKRENSPIENKAYLVQQTKKKIVDFLDSYCETTGGDQSLSSCH